MTRNGKTHHESGLTLIEMLVSLVIGLSVMAGALQILIQSKSSFIAERELAALQENARSAFRLLQDEIHMAGYNSCGTSAQSVANSITGAATSWELNGTGIEGYEHEAGIASFPVQIRADVAPATDAIVVRKGDSVSYLVTGHTAATSRFVLNRTHNIDPADIVIVAAPDCVQVGYFQAVSAADNYLTHTTATTVSPGNCTGSLAGAFDCGSGVASLKPYVPGSVVMKLISRAYYVGQSEVGEDIPALFREHLGVVTKKADTWNEELVQGVENMQIQYAVDLDANDSDTAADIYLNADDIRIDWNKIRNVRISLRVRSGQPVYSGNIPYDEFMDIPGTGGSDRFMREIFTTTINLRNL